MAKRRRIPSLVPDGLGSKRVDTYEPKQRTHRSSADRAESEPWRKSGYGSAYRANRQLALDATGGTCARCGKQIAHLDGGRWSMDCGEVHHVRSLSDGGGCDVGNLVPLCVPCHRAEDAARRASTQ